MMGFKRGSRHCEGKMERKKQVLERAKKGEVGERVEVKEGEMEGLCVLEPFIGRMAASLDFSRT